MTFYFRALDFARGLWTGQKITWHPTVALHLKKSHPRYENSGDL